MEFEKLLLKVEKNLGPNDVRALVFLCADLLGRGAAVESAVQLFRCLCDQDLLSAERPHLLSELLSIIQRTRLLRQLDLSSFEQSNHVSDYRKLLYRLSEELTQDDLKNVKFLLNNDLPRRRLEDNVTALEVFMEMDHMDLISETNLDFLENIVKEVCPVLVEKIRQFKAQNSMTGRPIAQETGELRFEPLQPTQVPFDLLASAEEADPASVFNDQDEHGAEPPERTGLLAETSTCESAKGENQTSSRTETYVPSQANAGLETYPMAAQPRGYCLIINNYDFSESGRGKRVGTMVDEECLKGVFSWLGFKVEIQRDCTSKKMLSLMQELAGRSQREWDCVVCCVLSHGLEGCVCGVDNDTVDIRMLMEPFVGTKCPSMVGKPKLFFIQACQGNKNQDVVDVDSDKPHNSGEGTKTVPMKDCIPHHADFLLGMATVPDFVSYRERENGTWYIQSLCENLVDMVPRGIDLVSILTKVNADVSKKSDQTGFKKQMPQPAFTLRKKIVFPVPTGPIPALPNFTTC